jgi:lipopolysaccharide export system permease protein
MIGNWTLGRYFARQYLVWFLVFLGGLAGTIFLFEVAELMRRAADRPDASFALILRMGLYKLPDTVEQIMPFVVLFASVFTFWRLTRSQELVIARGAGISAWQFLAPALIVTVIFSFINVTLINPLDAELSGRYKQLEMHYLQRIPTIELTGAGLWLRQRDKDRAYLLHADHVSENPLTLTPLIALIYDTNDHYLGRIDAPSAVLKNGVWDIQNAWINWDQKPTQHADSYQLSTALTLGKIQESMAPPNTISFWELPNFIRALKAIGLPPARHELRFQELLAEPVMLCSMIFFAALFSLRMNRQGNIMPVMAGGLVLGLTVFILNNIVGALGANQIFPVIPAAWAIPLVALALSNTALLYLEDG